MQEFRIEPLLEDYLEHMKNNNHPQYLRNAHVLRRFVTKCQIDLRDVKRKEVMRYIWDEYGGLSPRTIENYITILNKLFSFLEENNYIEKNPFPSYRTKATVAANQRRV